MNAAHEERLHACFPYGLLRWPDLAKINKQPSKDFWARLPPLLALHGFYCEKPHLWSGYENVCEFHLHRIGDPQDGYFNDNKEEKIEALRCSGLPFVQLTAKVSTIVPALFIDIQETWFDPDTCGVNSRGRYDDGLKTKSFLRDTQFEPWASLATALRALGNELGLADFEEAELKQDVPFVTRPIYSDDDDAPLFDSEADEITYLKNLPQDICWLCECLFDNVI
ncbi:hypothetical protein [Propionivibrio sp.]|uniref:hypothetical protein n=1 Tax=Propionivibrio sp. TaxID=2212460 RepID=UPI003BF20117